MAIALVPAGLALAEIHRGPAFRRMRRGDTVGQERLTDQSVALAAIWLRAELAHELVIAVADRRPAADWRVLRDLCGKAGARLTLVVERCPSHDQLAALGDDVRELTLSELVDELPPPMPARQSRACCQPRDQTLPSG